jgi:hypothetical protein
MLLHQTQNKQSLADFRAKGLSGLVNLAHLCQPVLTEPASYHLSGGCTHFRTPSPRGQLVPEGAMLPVFFPDNPLIWQDFAERNASRSCVLFAGSNLSSLALKKEAGDTQCPSRNSLSRAAPLRASQRAATQVQTKPCLAVRQAPAWPLLRTPIRSKVRLSARRETLFTVRLTPENATNWCEADAPRSSETALRSVNSRNFVLNSPQWASTAQLRGSFYETSNLHFCSGRNICDRRMHEVRRGIQPRKYFAFGFPNRRLAGPRVTAHPKYQIAISVPHPRGGFLRFPHPIPPFQLKKDIPCSTRS